MQPKMKYVGCLPWNWKKVEWILSHVKQRLVIHLLLILFIYEVFFIRIQPLLFDLFDYVYACSFRIFIVW